MSAASYEVFIGYLRSALHYLYDHDQLRRSPLVEVFGITGRLDVASVLQKILTEAIETLKPPDDESPQSRAWRIYDALHYRYVRRFDRDIVADQLGISGRQLRREQRAAIEALANRLFEQYQLALDAAEPPLTVELPDDFDRDPSGELARLKELPPEEPADSRQAITAALELAAPLASQWQVRLESRAEEGLPGLAAAQMPFRHTLLTLLNVGIPRAEGGTLRIEAQRSLTGAAIHLLCRPLRPAVITPLTEPEKASLEMARQLAGLSGGELAVAQEGNAFRMSLLLPALEQVPILVVDDNADAHQLLQRYVAGTRYAIVSTREPEKALALAAKLVPRMIILDLMMPGVDGWEVLSQFRHNPATSQIPIVVCTILPQEPLALALGANAFLQKPITRQQFLDALAQHATR